LSIEITLKTYEEIWLSKLFEFSIYYDPKQTQSKPNKDDEVNSLRIYYWKLILFYLGQVISCV
jgi:hypothetical protein